MSGASRAERATWPALVPDGFAVPTGLRTARFALEPLGPQHNEADHAAWTSSIEHIRSTPGFAGRSWPAGPMALDQNRADLQLHADDFAARRGFAYTVRDPADEDVIGCVYLYPPRRAEFDVDVRSWVRADRADLDPELYATVRNWLQDVWPFDRPDYPAR